jgi:dipeptidyl aminopeptidase/acylaminoacyl peptidase
MIYPNIRGSGGYGKTYLRLDNHDMRQNATKDIGALLDWIKAQPHLDAELVLVRGASAGAYVALDVAATYGDRVRGVIALSGPSNIATFLETVDRWYQDRLREEYGDERDKTMRQYFDRIAPVSNIKKMKGPLLIAHGRRDDRVPATESDQMIAAAKRQGINVWSLLIKNEGHGFVSPRTRVFVFLAELVFIRKCLLGL